MNKFLPYAAAAVIILVVAYLTRNVMLPGSGFVLGWCVLFVGATTILGTFWATIGMTRGG